MTCVRKSLRTIVICWHYDTQVQLHIIGELLSIFNQPCWFVHVWILFSEFMDFSFHLYFFWLLFTNFSFIKSLWILFFACVLIRTTVFCFCFFFWIRNPLTVQMPAPLSMSFIGYPFTCEQGNGGVILWIVGLTWVDYLLSGSLYLFPVREHGGLL